MTLKSVFASMTAAFLLVGCASGPQPEAKAEMNAALENATSTRAIYDASEGDFSKVSEADKKKLIDRYKSEEGAKKVFADIKNPPNGMGGAPVPPKSPN